MFIQATVEEFLAPFWRRATLVAVAEFGLRGAVGRERRFDEVWEAARR